MKPKLVIIGIDGVPYGLMEDFSGRGIMPNFKKLREKGIFNKMESSIPEISSISWSSIISGKNPGEHDIYGFTDIIPNTYTMRFPNFSSMKAKAFWERDDGRKNIIINVPSTYPAKPLNGIHISGFVALDLDKAVYPKEIIPELEELNYKIDVDSEKGHISKLMFLKDLFETLEARRNTFKKFWDKEWDTFMFVITGSDRLGHFLQKAYKDENAKYHEQFIEFYKRTDEIIGEIVEKMNENDSLIMISDHGMGEVKINVNLNVILQENGFLALEDSETPNLNSIQNGTKAFALDPSRIYLNKEGKYPRGCVKKEDEEELLNKLTDLFKSLEFEGQKVIKKIYRKEDIYNGNFLNNAPDLILLANKGFSLRGSLSKTEIFDKDIFQGVHTQDDAFLFVKSNKNLEIPENPDVTNVLRIIDQVIYDETT